MKYLPNATFMNLRDTYALAGGSLEELDKDTSNKLSDGYTFKQINLYLLHLITKEVNKWTE